MAAGYVQVPPDSSGQRIDMISLSVGGIDVVRQTFALANDAAGQTIAQVQATSASANAIGLVVRPCTATVALVTGSTIGISSISGLPAVAISGTALVAGVVSLAAGTAVIGDLNAISRTVQVAIATPFTLQGISTTVQVAIATPYILQGISTTVQVAIATPFTIQGISTTVSTVTNITAISAGVSIAINAISAGVTIGINSISAPVTVRVVTPAVPSASRGPRCATASTSANVTLIPSPGVGASIHVTMLSMHNASANFSSLRFGTSASIQTIAVPATSSGGGAVFHFSPPLVLSASEAAVVSIKPNGSYAVFNTMFYVA